MSLNKDKTAVWSDIQSLYSNLNTQLSRFSISQISVPDHKDDLSLIQDINDLKTAINKLTSNSYLSNKVSTSGVTVPVRDSVMAPLPFTQMKTIVERVAAFCNTNASQNTSSFFSSCFSFCDFDHTFFGSTAQRCNSFFSGSAQNGAFFLDTNGSFGGTFWSQAFKDRDGV